MSTDLVNVALLVSYDGRGYYGWQRHAGKPTIQESLETAVHDAFGVRSGIFGSGRTDRGAHATGQVATVPLPGSVPESEIAACLNRALPDDIAIEDAQRVPEELTRWKERPSSILVGMMRGQSDKVKSPAFDDCSVLGCSDCLVAADGLLNAPCFSVKNCLQLSAPDFVRHDTDAWYRGVG